MLGYLNQPQGTVAALRDEVYYNRNMCVIHIGCQRFLKFERKM